MILVSLNRSVISDTSELKRGVVYKKNKNIFCHENIKDKSSKKPVGFSVWPVSQSVFDWEKVVVAEL